MMPAPQFAAVSAAAAQDTNDDLTVILNALEMAIPDTEGDSHDALMEAHAAVQRIIWHAAWLAVAARRAGARPSAATMEAVMERRT